jgi:hypothetical protein
MSKKKAKIEKIKIKRGFIACPDCGGQYKIGVPHYMFCQAKTCEECHTTFTVLIPKDDKGHRVCDNCQNLDGKDL